MYKKFHEDLTKESENTCRFCDGHINEFCLMLQKGVYPYEYMDSWAKFSETSLPIESKFYCNSTMGDMLDLDCKDAERVWKDFEILNLGNYHDLYVKSDTPLLVDVFKNFRSKCLEIYELDLAHFLLALGLTWQACLKKTKVELELLTDINILLMVENRIRDSNVSHNTQACRSKHQIHEKL